MPCSGYRDSHEFTYVSLSQVIVKSLRSGARIVLKSNVGFEIKKINIFQARAQSRYLNSFRGDWPMTQERFLVAHTPESILLGDLQTCPGLGFSMLSLGKRAALPLRPAVRDSLAL